ncbi:MAG TPA: sulfotransferase domain-containing protein [Vicinamibacterales bacterium]|nr:sulfotransferase domain-containing protein [Vicinamibacterales bacterium]
MKGIVWLASFPKSGNTWLRLLLANYFDADGTGIALDRFQFGRLASSRLIFDEWSVVDSSELTDAEADVMRPDMYRAMAAASPEPIFLKTHQAWSRNLRNEPLFPADATAAAIYAVRNPLDVAVSMAPHMNISLSQAVALMCNDTAAIGTLDPEIRMRFPERLMSWSGHVRSWLDESNLPLVLVRYEDLKVDPVGVFGRIVAAVDASPDAARIARAVEFTAFDRLQAQERELGFDERRSTTQLFFRGGRVGDGRRSLSDADKQRLYDEHGSTMERLGYSLCGEVSYNSARVGPGARPS